jgi:hypothetical protein
MKMVRQHAGFVDDASLLQKSLCTMPSSSWSVKQTGTPLLPSSIHNTYFQRQASHIVSNPMHLNIIHLLYNHLHLSLPETDNRSRDHDGRSRLVIGQAVATTRASKVKSRLRDVT